MSDILEKLTAAARARVVRERARLPLEAVKAQAREGERPFRFRQALEREEMAFICEVKKASPSKGVIAPEFPYLEIARDYQAGGAAAISVLTEPDYFLGSVEYLMEIRQAVETPVLRKDFIVDEYQVHQSAALGADAILLICAILTAGELARFQALARDYGICCLVEAHDEAEVRMALEAGAEIIGINNRNLKTFQVDFENSLRLRSLVPPEVLFVAESGIHTPADVALLRRHGVDAVLVGEALMRSPDRTAALQALMGGEGAAQ